jgi:hypothetical protein
MKTPDGSMTYARFFDSVLREIEFGKIDQGISLIVGLFDALHMQGRSLTHARQELVRHVLHQMLLEEPIYAQAAGNPSNASRLTHTVFSARADEQISSTGRRLFEATNKLPLIRALRQRRAVVQQKFERAWQSGLRICLLGTSLSSWQTALSGRDLSNVTLIDNQEEKWPNLETIAGAPFDLICLPDIADAQDGPALLSLLAQLKPIVSPAGTVVLSALCPGHLGSGWREACLNWKPNMHGQEALLHAASDTGFSALIYGDQSDCIIWAELRPNDLATIGGNKNHDY